MKKKLLLGLAAMLIMTMAFAAGIGTYAYYMTRFESSNNVVTTAKFNITQTGFGETGIQADQTLFDLNGVLMAPGRTGQKSFSITSDVEVNTVYDLKVTTAPDGDKPYIFRAGTPVKLSLVDGSGNKIKDIISGKVMSFNAPGTGTMNYAVKYEWPWETNNVDDKQFAGNTGLISIEVVARQVKDGNFVRNVYMRDARTSVRYWDRNNQREVEYSKVAGIKKYVVKNVVADMTNNDAATQMPYGDIVITQKAENVNSYQAVFTVGGVENKVDVTLADANVDPGKLYFRNSGQNFELKITIDGAPIVD